MFITQVFDLVNHPLPFVKGECLSKGEDEKDLKIPPFYCKGLSVSSKGYSINGDENMAFLILLYLAGGILYLVGWAKIFSKAGYSGWLCLVWLIPIANIILFFWFAFSEWPEKESPPKRMD